MSEETDPSIQPALARFYRKRWRQVEEVKAAEASAMSDQERLRELCVLFEFARRLGPSVASPDVEDVRRRWVRLKELHSGKPE